jgi:hypothetical protein
MKLSERSKESERDEKIISHILNVCLKPQASRIKYSDLCNIQNKLK